MVRLLERSIRLVGLVWTFLALVRALGLFQTFSRAHYSIFFFSIDKIVTSLGPSIPDFGRYKMGCLHLSCIFFFFQKNSRKNISCKDEKNGQLHFTTLNFDPFFQFPPQTSDLNNLPSNWTQLHIYYPLRLNGR
jgi:hypothetical protein